LRKHLDESPGASLQPAKGLGHQAVTLGLETLDLVRIHDRTLSKLVSPNDAPATRGAMVRRAGTFFSAAITPLEKMHRTARETNVRLDKLNQMLRQRGAELAASKQHLKGQIQQRRLAEASLKRSEGHYRQLLEQSRLMQDQLRLLSRQLLFAQEEERKKISRELHDVIAQTLTGINVRLTALRKEAAFNTEGIEQNIARTQQLVQRSVNVVHKFARELRPTVLDDLGLIPALHTFLNNFQKETGIRVTFSASAKVEQGSSDQRTVLYRVAQEALANVVRHARASRVKVKIRKLDGVICMEIRDNGKGFQQDHVLRGKKKNRLGLLGMRERVESIKGSFTVRSAPGSGTTILVRVPPAGRDGTIRGRVSWK
jgi:signal transduction histidine kinase